MRERSHRSRVTALYRRLLVVYPPAFRSRYRDEMASAFEAKYSATRRRGGPTTRARFLLATLADVVRNGLAERWSSRQTTRSRHRVAGASTTARALLPGVLGDALRDARHALRVWRARPGLTLAAVLTVAVGIGANTAVYSVVHAILLRPLDYRDPDRLAALWPDRFMSYADLLYVAERARSCTSIGGMSPGWGMALTGAGEPAQLTGGKVTGRLFETLGVPALAGRTLAEHDAVPGAGRVVVLGHALWRSRFGGDPATVGRLITLDGETYEVVGVMPPGFEILDPASDLWTPLPLDPDEWYFTGSLLLAIGRLQNGVAPAAAEREFQGLLAQRKREEAYPDDFDRDARLVPLHEAVVGDVRPTLLALWTFVGVLLVMAGANLGTLLIARGVERGREMAIRDALGAGRRRLVRQVLTEGGLLAFTGGVGGVLAAHVTLRWLVSRLPPETPRLAEIALEPVVVAAGVLVAVVTGVVFAATPAAILSRARAAGCLRTSPVTAASVAGLGLRRTLVIAQVAVALVLTIGAGLMLRTVWHLTQVDPGFDPGGVLTLRVQPTGERYERISRVVAYLDEIASRLRALPAVQSVGAVQHLPIGRFAWTSTLDEIEGRSRPEGSAPPTLGWRIVTPDYFATLRIPLHAGRGFTAHDTAGTEPVALVNRAMAARYWPDGSPIGARVRARNATQGDFVTIVGVVGDVRHDGLAQPVVPELYRPHAQVGHRSMALVVRVAGDPASIAADARRIVWAIDPDVPISDLEPYETFVGRSVSRERLIASLLLAFAAVGIVLGVGGLYASVAADVGRRSQELAVRLALGARPRRLLGGVVVRGLSLGAAGVLVGLVAALGASRLLASLLFGVAPADPSTYAALSLLLLVVVGLASFVPARRAARLDASAVLRGD